MNMHGPGFDGSTDCYLGPFTNKSAADAAGKSEIERQENRQYMEEFIKKHGLTEDQFFGREKIEGDLWLRGLTSIPENFNPTVGGDLWLDGHLYAPKKMPSNIFSWQGGKYIRVDGIFSEVIHKRGNVWKCKEVNRQKFHFVVFDGVGKYAHGNTINEAFAALAFKVDMNQSLDKYKGMAVTDVLSFGDAIECYRLITRACEFGTRKFIEEVGIEQRDYSIAEIVEITRGRYGASQFEQFFTSK